MINVYSFHDNDINKYTVDPIYSYVQAEHSVEAVLRLVDDREKNEAGGEGLGSYENDSGCVVKVSDENDSGCVVKEADECDSGCVSTDGDDNIIGILTGGRYFVRNDQPLTESYISRIMNSYDVILPFEVGEAFQPGAFIARKGLIRDVLSEVSEEMAEDQVPDDTTGEETVRNAVNLEDIGKTDLAVDSDIFVQFLKSYIFRNHLKVKSESVLKTDPEIWNTGYKKIEALRAYMDAVLAEYIGLRRETGFEDSFADEDPYKGDFDGKRPVWICWWQGISEAPELVRACVDSVKRNCPPGTEPVLITMENWHEYVTFTPAICDKFERGIISYTHLADALRTELLYRYGGLWIDATYYVSGVIPEWIFSEEFYTTAFKPPLWGMDVMQGRWSSSLLGAAHRHSSVMQFVMEGLWLYWEQTDEIVDYFFWDYILDAGYRHIDAIRRIIDGVAPSPAAVYDLQLMMNQRISKSGKKRLAAESVFYKINRRNEYVEKTSHGFETYYGYITEQSTELSAENGHVVIDCADDGELIRAIREVNPDRIIDMNGYYEARGRISRGVIDDVILHPLVIELSRTAENSGAVDTGSYNSECNDSNEGYNTIPVYDSVITNLPNYKPVAEIVIKGEYRFFCYDDKNEESMLQNSGTEKIEENDQNNGIDEDDAEDMKEADPDIDAREYIPNLISIIVPVYNAERTLQRCVSTLVSQTYPDIEIILVDDASTDSSRELMMQLEKLAPDRILVICSDENRGPGGARNIALQYARGEYIGFVDSDDYVQSSFYERLVSEMKTGCHDIVDCGYYNEAKDKGMLHTGRDTRGVLCEAQKGTLIVSGGYLWSRLYRRELFDRCGIVFRENCILEDSEILATLIMHAHSVGAVEDTLYWYSATAGSASDMRSAGSYIDNICNAIEALALLREQSTEDGSIQSAIECEIIQMYGFGVVMALKDAQTGRTLDTVAQLNRLRDLRRSSAAPGYGNPYIAGKIEKADIDIMKRNDADPKALYHRIVR